MSDFFLLVEEGIDRRNKTTEKTKKGAIQERQNRKAKYRTIKTKVGTSDGVRQ